MSADAVPNQAEQLYRDAVALLTVAWTDGLYNQNQIAAAVSIAERAAALVDSVPCLYFLAHTTQQLGDAASARQFFERALVVAESAGAEIPLDQTYWLRLRYAELLRQQVIPNAAPGSQAELKRQVIEHYEAALTAGAALANASAAVGNNVPAASSVRENRVHMLNTVGALLSDLYRFREAVVYLERAIELEPSAVQPMGNLALALNNLGQPEAALRANERALELQPDQPQLLHNAGLILHALGRPDAALASWKRAHELNPSETETISAIAGYYSDAGDPEACLSYLQLAQTFTEVALERDPTQHSIIAEALSNQVSIVNAKLPLVYQSTSDILDVRTTYAADLRAMLKRELLLLRDPLSTANIGGMGYYAVYQGFNDVVVRSQLAQIYRRGVPALSFIAPHVLRSRHRSHRYPLVPAATQAGDDAEIHSARRIRVGFHSGLLRYHSVGLLTQGVITQLDRRKFEVIVLIDSAGPQDDLTRRVLASADDRVLLGRSLADAHQRIAALKLDVLVFTEIGMEPPAYFLAFARLALRTVAFWGHAVTTGIDTVDYFVSSSLFHAASPSSERADSRDGATQQAKYAECLYEMRHLTTYFLPPLPPTVGVTDDGGDRFRASLGLPPRSVLDTMVLVPQTLYKLHPDFDVLVERILLQTPDSSFLVALTGAAPRLADATRARWRRTLSADVYKRVYFVRMLSTQEFMDLCAVADVVLDPFPVGGGRSSLEVFSVGTPIVLLATRTTILQLTAGMYTVMGFDDLVAFTEDEYVAVATRLVRDHTLRERYRRRILASKAKLFENRAVVDEWEQFLVAILAARPPAERALDGDDDESFGPRSRAQCPLFSTTSGSSQVPVSHPLEEPLFAIRVTLTGHTDGDGPDRNEFELQLQSADDDPFETITRFVARYPSEFDWLHQNLTAKLLWNARQRLQQPIVGRFAVEHDASGVGGVDPIEVRYGDDLHLMARAHLMKAFKQHGEVLTRQHLALLERLIARLKEQVPEHTSPAWIAARSFQLKNPVAVGSESAAGMRSAPNASATSGVDDDDDDCVTLLMTTCKRLPLFLRTIASLERVLDIASEANRGGATTWSTWFCAVLVVDDNSSAADRRAMRARVPSESVEFLFKSPEQRGHAKSLNLGLKRVRSRYVVYLEDDWEFRAPPQRPSRFLSDALGIYASSDPAHEFAFWPGFSLNPGLWDLRAITRALCTDAGGSEASSTGLSQSDGHPVACQHLFDEALDIFEHSFSLEVWRSGLRVAFLAAEHAVHIGAPTGSNHSAYVLNGMRRRFDAPAPAA
ncbi:hypothetical protein PybrP1_005294 [[Pythium] brassicae (nom. inval.)]|nr:hypothetical protein PybrP1_005294 [[Pythium] brassicae (nom. inval.)]